MPEPVAGGAAFLTLSGVRKEYRLRGNVLAQLVGRGRHSVRAVDGVNFSLSAGEILGLVGESGSGKTTVGRMITLLERPTAGTIAFEGNDLARFSRRDLRRYRRAVQMIFQNPYESVDPRYTVGGWVSEPLRFLGTGSRAERQGKVLATLSAVGLSPAADYLDRFAHELSGGQRQRVDIARAMAVGPRLLVADEPVSMLDVSVRSGILKLLLDLRERTGIGCVFVSHDLAVARYVSDRIAVMYLGKIMEIGPTDLVVTRPEHPYTRMLLSAVPEVNAATKRVRVRRAGEAAAVYEIPSGCRFRTRCPVAGPRCAEEEPALGCFGAGRAAACHRAGDSDTRGN